MGAKLVCGIPAGMPSMALSRSAARALSCAEGGCSVTASGLGASCTIESPSYGFHYTKRLDRRKRLARKFVVTLISLHVVTRRWGGRRDLNGALELRASAEVGELLLRGVFPCPSGERQLFATQGRVFGGAWCYCQVQRAGEDGRARLQESSILVLLNGKGGPTSGAELSFVYLGPGSHFLVLSGVVHVSRFSCKGVANLKRLILQDAFFRLKSSFWKP